MKQPRLENAIYNLDFLLKSNESREIAFQNFLEENIMIFEVLGYKKVYPKLRLDLNQEDQERFDLKYLEPDFIVEKQGGIFEIFEIKTPQELFLTKSTARKAFRSQINSYISQSVAYADYFKDSNYRKLTREKYGLDITREVDIVILAGLDKENDIKRVHEETRQRSNRIQIITYDRLLSSLRFDYANHYSSCNGLFGTFLYGIFEFNKMPNEHRKYIFDYGHFLDRNRLSVYLNKNNKLVFELIDKDGNLCKETGPSIRLHERISLLCQFGIGKNFTLLEISINGNIALSKYIEEEILLEIDYQTASVVVGASIDNQHSNSDFYAFVTASGSALNFEGRISLNKLAQNFLQDCWGNQRPNCFWVGKGGYLKKGEHSDKDELFGNVKFLQFSKDTPVP